MSKLVKPVLDGKGFVELLDTFGDDLTVVNAARVSFAKETAAFGPQDTKLINYLAKHNHITLDAATEKVAPRIVPYNLALYNYHKPVLFMA